MGADGIVHGLRGKERINTDLAPLEPQRVVKLLSIDDTMPNDKWGYVLGRAGDVGIVQGRGDTNYTNRKRFRVWMQLRRCPGRMPYLQ